MTGQVKVLAWSRYDAEKQDNLVDTSKLFSSVGWNLVNWNVERTRICLSESAPSYGVDSSFAFSFLRVLPEPNLQESEESRGSHHLFSLMNHYELVWFTTIQYLCPIEAAPKHNIQASLMILPSVCTTSWPLKLTIRCFGLKTGAAICNNLKTQCLWVEYFKWSLSALNALTVPSSLPKW